MYPTETDWLYNTWDGTEEHYTRSSYKGVLNIPLKG